MVGIVSYIYTAVPDYTEKERERGRESKSLYTLILFNISSRLWTRETRVSRERTKGVVVVARRVIRGVLKRRCEGG